MNNNKFWDRLSLLSITAFVLYMFFMISLDKKVKNDKMLNLKKEQDSLILEQQRLKEKQKIELQLLILKNN